MMIHMSVSLSYLDRESELFNLFPSKFPGSHFKEADNIRSSRINSFVSVTFITQPLFCPGRKIHE